MSLRIWDKTETLYLADGTPCTPEEVMSKWAFARHFPVLLEMAGPLVAAIDCFPTLVSTFGIDESLDDEEKIAEIIRIRTEQNTPNTDPTPEERQAAALEFQNMLALASMNVEPEEGGVPA